VPLQKKKESDFMTEQQQELNDTKIFFSLDDLFDTYNRTDDKDNFNFIAFINFDDDEN